MSPPHVLPVAPDVPILEPDTPRYSQRTSNPRRMWTAAEDEKLKAMVQQYGDARGSQGHWKAIAASCPGRTAKDCRKRWFHSLHPALRKGRWTEQEDRVLLDAYAELGPAWHDIALMIPGRKDDQCSKRYNEILDPSAKTRLRRWTAEEDGVLTQGVIELGHRWSAISARLQNRPPLTCRNRWRHLSDRGPMGPSPPQLDMPTPPGMVLETGGTPLPGPGSPSGGQISRSTTDYLATIFSPDAALRNSFVDFLPLSPETENLLTADMPDMDMLGFSGLNFQQMPAGDLGALTEYDGATDTQSSTTPGSAPVLDSDSPAAMQWSPPDSTQQTALGGSSMARHGDPIPSSMAQRPPPISTNIPHIPEQYNDAQWRGSVDLAAIERHKELTVDHAQGNTSNVHHHYYHHHYHHHHHHHHYHHPNTSQMAGTSTLVPDGQRASISSTGVHRSG